jgi:fructose-1,6-bisphosphatase/inositol monophosphatase family enzyme
VWVIDPIDGTRNFIAGNAEFGVMVALVRRGQTIAAWIHDPNTGDTLMAEQGGGVMLRGHKMRLAGLDANIPPAAIIGSRLKKALSKPEVAAVLERLPELVVGSAAAFDYARLFIGDVVFGHSLSPRVGYLLYRQCKPWDHLPGLMMHAEALGYAADFSGAAYNMNASPAGLLVAPNLARWEEFRATVGSVLPFITME